MYAAAHVLFISGADSVEGLAEEPKSSGVIEKTPLEQPQSNDKLPVATEGSMLQISSKEQQKTQGGPQMWSTNPGKHHKTVASKKIKEAMAQHMKQAEFEDDDSPEVQKHVHIAICCFLIFQ